MQVTSASAFLRLREQLDITSEDIVRQSHVSVATVRNAEKRSKITWQYALQILHAVHARVRESNLQEVTLDDLSVVLE
jgi:DNA-binding transcriptional regulator YiaG